MAIKSELLKQNDFNIENFREKCRIGENDSYISNLIREDLIQEFIIYTTKNNVHLSSNIIPSIFETNLFLVSKPATLIEYAAFFGSIQIFQYLLNNYVELTPSLWLYAIHGNNPDIIHLLETNQVEPNDKTYCECLKESIKCHHNSIAEYIFNNLMSENIEIKESSFKNNIISYGFHYYNYEILHNNYQNLKNFQFLLYYACLYDHFPIIKLLIDSKKVDLNQTIVLRLPFMKLLSTFQ